MSMWRPAKHSTEARDYGERSLRCNEVPHPFVVTDSVGDDCGELCPEALKLVMKRVPGQEIDPGLCRLLSVVL